ncbi:kunitz-like toxin PcKuz3 [Neocloeon triangulifer]|uniref:kunitz-like toxin PcKuz3 n=1 Tax=Neocloeon triangulifer TaxID=2078957 RepID=UPI00286F17DF|nr:kunitz-like toxin PcKuz3 [Neocloeon triangulifer]
MLTRYLILLALLCLAVHVNAQRGIGIRPPLGDDICLLEPMQRGARPCEGYIPKFTFNIATRRCERFIYGGCNGTANLFDTKGLCTIACRHLIFPRTG